MSTRMIGIVTAVGGLRARARRRLCQHAHRTALIASVLAVGSAVAPAAALASGAEPNPNQPTTCAFPWVNNVAAGYGTAAGPEGNSSYWVQSLTYTPGEQVVIAGQYPDARYAGFNVYNFNGESFMANGVGSSLSDDLIDPDPGSANPWRPDATAFPERNFTLTLTDDAAPDTPNTLPLTPAGTAGGQTIWIVYRVTLPSGGVPAGFASVPVPNLTITQEGGTSETRPGCTNFTGENAWIPKITSLGGGAVGTNLQFLAPNTTTWLIPNADTSYVDSSFLTPPAGDVVVLTGKAPKAPSGAAPAVWPQENMDMLYWSMCIYTATASLVANKEPDGGIDYGCRADEATNQSDGKFLYVIGSESQRSQIEEIPGATFLPFSNQATPGYVLLYRNTKVNPRFAYGTSQLSPGGGGVVETEETMGHFYPRGYTCSLEAFRANGLSACTPAVSTEHEHHDAVSTPTLSAGATPNADGRFTLSWTGANPLQYLGLSYTLQHRNAASSEWTTVASGIEALSYEFAGAGESEGTWEYRVQAVDTTNEQTGEWSAASSPVKVDETPPDAPTASASRAPDYSGGGGWYKDSVEVSFAANGDPNLSDGSPGSGVNPSSIPASQTFVTSGSHTVCGTVTDNVGNVSAPGCTTVQVDATPPTLEISCPATVAIGSSATATVVASDAYSGLRANPSGTVPINTSKSGPQTITRTAVSNVGLETTSACSTYVGYYVVISGPVARVTVRAGEAVELTRGASVRDGVNVRPGGALDVEGATLAKSLTASGAALLRVCGARIGAGLRVLESTGPVTLGEGTSECGADTISGSASVTGNTAGVLINGDKFGASLAVRGNSGGISVTDNKIVDSLTVLGNTGTVTDRPNEVGKRSKLQ